MKFGIHNPSWLFGTDSAGIFDSVQAKAQWAEEHGFTWFSVMGPSHPDRQRRHAG